jgi:DNA-binding NarL/FixJ family response regulator
VRRRYSFGTILVGKSGLLREGLARILRSANFRILASVSRADDLPASKAPSCQQLFLLVHTSDHFDTQVKRIELFRSRHPDARIAVVADRYRLDELVSAFRAGANGYFVDVITCDALVKSLELVMMGETVFPPAFLSSAQAPERDHQDETPPGDNNNRTIPITEEDGITPQLSPRERSILNFLIEGDSNKSIARKIDIAEATVKVHVKAILRKIRVHNRTQAAIWGMNNGSLALATTTNSPPLAAGLSRRVPIAADIVSEIKQINGSPPPDAIESEANQAEVPRFDGLIRKDLAQLRK